MTDQLIKTLERQAKAHERVIAALAHLPREKAMSIIMSFMSLDKVEELADFQEEHND